MVSPFSFGRLQPTAKLQVSTMVDLIFGDCNALSGSDSYLYVRAATQAEFICGEVHGWIKPTLRGLGTATEGKHDIEQTRTQQSNKQHKAHLEI